MAKITFRAIEADDLPLLQQWRNSDNVMPYCRQYRPLSLADMAKWYQGLVKDNDYNITNDLFVIETGKTAIGVGGLVRIDWRNRKGELSFYLAKFDEELAINAISKLIQYAFATLNLWKIYFPCYEFNPFIQTYKKVMDLEYIAKKEYYYEGKYWDRSILVKYNDTLQNKCSL